MLGAHEMFMKALIIAWRLRNFNTLPSFEMSEST